MYFSKPLKAFILILIIGALWIPVYEKFKKPIDPPQISKAREALTEIFKSCQGHWNNDRAPEENCNLTIAKNLATTSLSNEWDYSILDGTREQFLAIAEAKYDEGIIKISINADGDFQETTIPDESFGLW